MGTLKAISIKSKKPGRHADGDGLYLLVKPTGTRSWMMRVQVNGKRRDLGLGAADTSDRTPEDSAIIANIPLMQRHALTLAEARDKADQYRRMMKAGLDPAEELEKAKRTVPTFKACATECHESMKAGWRNAKHRAQWINTLDTYVFPEMGSKKVDQIETHQIVKVLAPIWLTKPETARRVRQRIAAVLDYAHSQGFRPTEAPTRSVGKGLPKQPKKDGHFEAMPYEEVPDFMVTLRGANQTMGRLALMFAILTAGRSGEVRGASWTEIDEKKKLWVIPAERMKAQEEHIVPLTAPMLAILETVKPLAGDRKDWKSKIIFPGNKAKPLSDMTLTKILRDMGLSCDVHGFRSSFRDWVSEKTNFPGEIAEKSLAHAIPNKVEAAYKRGAMLEKRRKLMEAWAAYLGGRSNVVNLAARA
ncbi:MAG: integrase arm-type DNA-binding domain-containing protein [Sphingobium sp.]